MQTINRENIQEVIGKVSTSDWFTVTQEQINQFADCTLDHQFIHTNPELAEKTMFGSTIAHGLLSLSMLPHFAESFGMAIEGAYMGINYGFDKVRFISPVKVNSRIRAKATITKLVERRPGQFQCFSHIEVEIEGSDKPALLADWITMQLVK